MIPPVERTVRDPETGKGPEDLRIRLTSRLLAGSFALLVLAVAGGLLLTPDPVGAVIAVLLVLVTGAAALHVRALSEREGRRDAEAESVTRLLRGLARSVSPDAIVGAIAGELAPATDADHVVVIRLRGEPPRLDATLVSTRPGVPSSTTRLPISDLEDPAEDERGTARPPYAVPVAAEAAVIAGHERAPAALAGAAAVLRSAAPAARPPAAGAATRAFQATASWRGASDAPGTPSGDRDRAGGRSLKASRAAGARRIERERAQRIADRLAERAADAYGLRSTLASPLVVDGQVAGALVLSRRTPGAWPASSRRRLDEAATEASVALDRARSYQAAETRASTDALTGLPNRRYFDEFCGLLARRRRSGDAIGVLMIDIDRFKSLNDRHGHAVGDEVLRAVGGALIATVRDDDVPARYGGEEFVVLLRNPSREVAVEIGERVRRAVADLDLGAFGVSRVTVSVGVAVQRSPDQPVGEVVASADQALYRAKHAGRDRVVAA
jgi:diguanylate cyclase (GGDEF)-like protein